ncbi:hypothetical protein BGZ54_006448 [Gamsiella multidivaricata]|nr:hypothetical protein BGZ54_006448 [Gamsiella multidivaricata]
MKLIEIAINFNGFDNESTGTKARRHKSSQTFNRYRTTGHPAPHQAGAASEVNPAQSLTKPPRQTLHSTQGAYYQDIPAIEDFMLLS